MLVLVSDIDVCKVTKDTESRPQAATKTCKRCKEDFYPKGKEERCSHCLYLRKENRLLHRILSKEEEEEFLSIDTMVRSNGITKHTVKKMM